VDKLIPSSWSCSLPRAFPYDWPAHINWLLVLHGPLAPPSVSSLGPWKKTLCLRLKVCFISDHDSQVASSRESLIHYTKTCMLDGSTEVSSQ